MGQKVNPIIFRMGIGRTWTSRWYLPPRDYHKKLREDVEIRRFIEKRLRSVGIDRVIIERSRGIMTVTVHAAKPGMIIGRGGQGIEDLKKEIFKKFLPLKKGDEKINLHINVQEVSKPNLSASIVKEQIIAELERRIPFRRIMKQTLDRVMKAGALGVRITIQGRLNGAEIARSESLSVGKIPLHTLRADIDYSRGAAHTIFGAIGVKTWIYRGEIFEEKNDTARLNQVNNRK